MQIADEHFWAYTPGGGGGGVVVGSLTILARPGADLTAVRVGVRAKLHPRLVQVSSTRLPLHIHSCRPFLLLLIADSCTIRPAWRDRI